MLLPLAVAATRAAITSGEATDRVIKINSNNCRTRDEHIIKLRELQKDLIDALAREG